MFPNRTWFYDNRKNRLLSPEQTDLGNGKLLVAKGRNVYQCTYDGQGWVVKNKSRYFPVASTGLDDWSDREIIDGHLLYDYVKIMVVRWAEKWKRFYCRAMEPKERFYESTLEDCVIYGHALTTPELVPDWFDADKYFGIEAEEAV